MFDLMTETNKECKKRNEKGYFLVLNSVLKRSQIMPLFHSGRSERVRERGKRERKREEKEWRRMSGGLSHESVTVWPETI